MIYAAVLGYGTVGSGVVEVLEKNKELIKKRAGDEIQVKYVLDLREFPGTPVANRVVHDIDVIISDPEISVICETMGGNEPAFTFSKKALTAGKSVCTSNKELVANHGPELIRTAREHNCNYFFEASVGGGIPIIRVLNDCLTAEDIQGITGILNGTTNYILTKMDKEGADFDSVLKNAQELGYAERDPKADVEGYDACRKIAILSSLITGKTVRFEEIYTEGITGITREDFAYAKAAGRSIKLLAMCRRTENGLAALVAPCMIDTGHPLYGVSGVYNAVFVNSNMLENTMYYGRGAGKLPTASAVAADAVECVRSLGKHAGCLWEDETLELASHTCLKRRFFVRARADVFSEKEAEALFGPMQTIRLEGKPEEYGFFTKEMQEREFMEKLDGRDGILGRIRLEA